MAALSAGGPDQRGRGAGLGDPERGVDWAQVHLILVARWRIGLQAAARGRVRLVLTVIGWAMISGFITLATVGAYFAVRGLQTKSEYATLVAPLLHVAFAFVLVSLVVSPALGLRGNEFLDVTKLFVYPVNHRTVFVATVLGLLTSWSVLLFTCPLLAAVAAHGGSAAEVVLGLAATVVFVLVGVAAGQVGFLLFLDVFRSRKWRDVSRIVVALLGGGLYGGMRFVSGSAVAEGGLAGLRTIDGWKDWLLPLPSWWAAHAVTGVGVVRWLPALALPVLLAWLVVVAARLHERAYFGEIEERSEVAADSGSGFAGWIGRRFPGPAGGAVEKDLRILTRDPTVRILLIQQIAFAILPLVAAFANGGLGGDRGGGAPAPGGVRIEFLLAGIVYVPVLAAMALAINPLGTEGPGIQHILLTPVSRSTIVLGKTAALVLIVGGGLSALVATGALGISFFLERGGPGVALVRGALSGLESLCAFSVYAGIGGFVGAWLPQRIVTRDRRALRQSSAGRSGCTRILISLGGLAVGALACLPVSLAFHHPVLFRLAAHTDSHPYLAATVPFAVAYAALAILVGTRAGGAVLLAREEAVLSELTRSAE